MRLVRGLLVLMVFLQVSPALAQSGGLRLLLPNTAQPQSKQAPAGPGRVFPWKAGDAPPAVAGIRMGDDRARFESVLGKPSDTKKLGEAGLALTYQRRGVQVLYAPADGAAIIFLLTRAAGDLGGVRVGDKGDAVRGRWGEPSMVAGPMAIYRAGEWAVFVKMGEDREVKQLAISRVTDQAPAGAKFYRQNE